MWAADPGEKTNRNGRTVSQIGRASAARRRGARHSRMRVTSVAIGVNRALGPARSFGARSVERGGAICERQCVHGDATELSGTPALR